MRLFPILQLDDWVLCRIYNKKGVIERYDTVDSGADEAKPAAAPPAKNPRSAHYPVVPAMKIELSDYGFYQHPSPPATEMLCFGRSGSADRDSDPHSLPLLHTDSSSSDRALHSPSPDFPSDMDYAESPHPAAAGCGGGGWPGDDWGCAIDDDGFVIDESLILDDFAFDRDTAAFGDMLTFLQKPF
jgi:hypothetical protein